MPDGDSPYEDDLYSLFMSAAERMSRSSFRKLLTISQPRAMVRLPDRVWSDEQWTRIRLGHRSHDMDSKWNAFVEGSTLFAHRSWSGNGIYELVFTAADGGWQAATGVVESDPERYKPMSAEFDCVMAELVISSIILGEETADLRERFAQVVRSKPGGRDIPVDAVWHSALGLRSEG